MLASSAVRQGRGTEELPLKIWSCTACRRRKVRCDRRQPCAPCIRNRGPGGSIDCAFPVSGRVPRRSRVTQAAVQERTKLLGRLRRLEAMVGELGSQVEDASSDLSRGASENGSHGSTNGASERDAGGGLAMANQNVDDTSTNISLVSDENLADLQPDEDFGEMIAAREDGDLVVKESFWTVFCSEVENIFDAVHGSLDMFHRDELKAPNSSAGPNKAPEQYSGYYDFLLRNTSLASLKQEKLYPLPSQVPFLWQVYLDNVDPFLKILHAPTMARTIRLLRSSYRSLAPSMRAVLVAVSHAAVMSLDNDEVEANFQSSKKELLEQYRRATEQALQQADIVESPNLEALQALTIYILVLQHLGEAKTAWILAGTLTRLAVLLNLHRDGSEAKDLSFFDQEMRRRLWWQICVIDSRSAQSQSQHASSPFKIGLDSFTTRLPANIDDIEIENGNVSGDERGWTDMTISLIQIEVWKLSHQLQTIETHDLEASRKRLRLLAETRSYIAEQYLKHVDSSQPLRLFVAALVQLFLSKLDLVLQSPVPIKSQPNSLSTHPAKGDIVFYAALSYLEFTHTLQKEPTWRGWKWQIHGSQQPPWQALRVVLERLSELKTWDSELEHVWIVIEPLLYKLPSQDDRSRQLSVLAEAIRKKRIDGLQPHSFHTSIADMQVRSDEMSLSWEPAPHNMGSLQPSEQFYNPTNDPAVEANVLPSSEIDWQAWNDMTWTLGSLWDFPNIDSC